jgi:hypothetical protein
MSAPRELPLIGWREWVGLPELGVPRIKAKIDTGARTASLHAFGIDSFEKGGAPYVRFAVHPRQRDDALEIWVEVPVVEYRLIRSSNGLEARRPVIETAVKLGKRTWQTEITLADRDAMGFRMLLGRHSIRQRYLVDPGRSYLRGARHAPLPG